MIRRHPTLIPLVLAVVVAALALGACGDDDDDDTAASETTSETTTQAEEPSGGGETIAIDETDFELDPADVTAKAGTVTFELSNGGEAPHNLEVEGDGFEEVSETIDPGDSTSFTVELEPGTYELYCTIDGHKDLGMEGELTVN